MGNFAVDGATNTATLHFVYGGETFDVMFVVTNVQMIRRFLVVQGRLNTPWTIIPHMSARRFAGAFGTINGKLYAVDGTDRASFLGSLEIGDPIARTWIAGAPTPNPRYLVGSAVVGSSLYVFGGCGLDCIAFGTPSSLVEAYDSAANTWTTLAPMPTARKAPAVGVVEGKIYVVGGSDSIGLSTPVVEVYDPVANTWTSSAPIPLERAYATAAGINGRLYVAGGITNQGLTSRLGIYDPTTNSWTEGAPMATARYSSASAVIGGHLHVMGGVRGDAVVLDSHEVYDPIANSWTPDEPLFLPRWGLMATAIGDRLYVAGGELDTGEVIANVEAIGDNTPPTIVAMVSPPPNASGWNTGNVTVTLNAADSGSGVQSITYGSTSVIGNTAAFVVSAEGVNTIPYFATDNVGNAGAPQSLVVRIDRTAPTTTASTTPPQINGWNTGDVTVTLNADDGVGSGVESITYGSTSSTTVAGNAASFVVTGEGTIGIVYHARDKVGNIEATRTLVLPIDRTPPTSALTVSSNPDNTLFATMTASDNPGGSGIVRFPITMFKDGAVISRSLLFRFPTTFSVFPGTTIEWAAVDAAGNSEALHSLAIPPDLTPPVTVAAVSPLPNAAGWNTSSVTVTLTATDTGGAGVQGVTYGSPLVPTHVDGPSATFVVSAEQINTIDYYAMDNSGNFEAPHSLVIRIDHTPPVITAPDVTADATSPSGANVTYPTTVADNFYPAPVLLCAPASGSPFGIGTATVNCTAWDAADNFSSATFAVTVNGASTQTTNLITAVQNLNLPAGTSTSLTSTLQAALDRFASGNATSACNQIDAFIAQTQAQSGKKLTVAQANQLIAVATRIKAAQGCP